MSNHALALPPESLAAKLDRLAAEVADMRALLERALHAVPPRTWLSIEEASALAGRTPQCVRGWCGTEAIGTMVKGRWQVDCPASHHARSR
jgi:hypothetical protein